MSALFPVDLSPLDSHGRERQGRTPCRDGRGDAPSDVHPSVIRGAKIQAGLDWLRCTGPLELLPDLMKIVIRFFGDHFDGCRGLMFFEKGVRWKNGVQVFYDDHQSTKRHVGCCLDISGKVLAGMEPDAVFDLMRALTSKGFKPTRIDIAVDFRHADDQEWSLIHEAVEACERGEVCGFRKWCEIKPRFVGVDIPDGHTLSLGTRGSNGSGRYVRIYCKGMETGTTGPYRWERFELEATGGVAVKAWDMIMDTYRDQGDALQTATDIALGSVDFRERNGQTGLSRRPRLQWWEDIVASSEPVCVRCERTRTKLEGFLATFNRCWVPTLMRMAHQSDQDLGDLFDEIVDKAALQQVDVDLVRDVVWEFLEERREGLEVVKCVEPGEAA